MANRHPHRDLGSNHMDQPPAPQQPDLAAARPGTATVAPAAADLLADPFDVPPVPIGTPSAKKRRCGLAMSHLALAGVAETDKQLARDTLAELSALIGIRSRIDPDALRNCIRTAVTDAQQRFLSHVDLPSITEAFADALNRNADVLRHAAVDIAALAHQHGMPLSTPQHSRHLADLLDRHADLLAPFVASPPLRRFSAGQMHGLPRALSHITSGRTPHPDDLEKAAMGLVSEAASQQAWAAHIRRAELQKDQES